MSNFTNDTAASTIFFVGVLQGFAFGMVFVSVNTVAFLTLPDNLRTYGASFQTLVRNVSELVRHLGGDRPALRGRPPHARRARRLRQSVQRRAEDAGRRQTSSISSTDSGRALVDQMLNMQALIIAYANDFRMLTVFALLRAAGRLHHRPDQGDVHRTDQAAACRSAATTAAQRTGGIVSKTGRNHARARERTALSGAR